MDLDVQRELVGRILDLNDRRTTTLAEHSMRIPAERYLSEAVLQQEQRELFRGVPVFACMSVDVAAPGDCVALDVGGVPVVVVRTAAGQLRAYLNVCRHRAATVVESDARTVRSFSCPFHGWVYDLDDGHLVGRPRSGDGFSDVDAGCLGLQRLGVGEAHGVVAVDTGGDEPDVDQWLAGMGRELGSFDYDSLVPYRRAQATWKCNWKLLLDTFLESYHVFALHRISLGAFYLGIASPFDAYGPHNRIVVPQTSILDQAEVPAHDRRLLPHAVVQYFLAPNVIVSNLYGYMMTWRFVPNGAAQTIVHHALYTYTAAETDDERSHFDERFDAARSVTGNEDFPASEMIHRNLATGAVDATIAGRNEPGMIAFHRLIEKAVRPT
jgi:phenylpropionate dioxygenase-like ring-hydroxylating dioxygenase large terminal subunit